MMTPTNRPLGSAPAPRLPLRPYAMFGRVCYATPEPDPVDPTPPDPKPAAKIELTADELDAKIAVAVKARDDAAAAQALKEKEEREAEEAKKRGEFEGIAASEKAKREKVEAELAAMKLAGDTRDYLAEKFPDYLTCAKYITPLLKAGADAAAIKASVEQYVADNPRTPKGSPGAPPAPRGRQSPTRTIQRPSTAGVASSRF